MNKLAVAAAAVLVIVLLALPRVVGSMTEARVRERVAAIDASGSVSAEVKSFERGWFTSTARIELTLVPGAPFAANAAAANPLLGTAPLPIAIVFAHGPIAVLDGVHFGWSKLVARLDPQGPGVAELEQTLGVPYVFEFRGRTSYRGDMTFDADAPPFQLPIDEALLAFSGATLDGSFARGQLAARARLDSVELTSPTGTFTVETLSASAANELRSRYVLPGTAGFSIGRVVVGDAFGGAMPIFEANDLRVVSDTTLDAAGALLDMRIDYALGSARIAESELAAAALGIALRNVDVAALEAYAAAVDGAGAGALGPADVLAALGPQLERALRVGPSLTLDPIRFRFDDEPFEGRIALAANPAHMPPAGPLAVDNPLLLLGLLETDADVRLSKALAQKIATLVARQQLGGDGELPEEQLEYMAEAQSGLMLTLLVGQGVLVEDGDGYRSSLELTDGALTLNGNPLPFGLP
jgi:uncharacterized protein YdgA (DUF945 family)